MNTKLPAGLQHGRQGTQKGKYMKTPKRIHPSLVEEELGYQFDQTDEESDLTLTQNILHNLHVRFEEERGRYLLRRSPHDGWQRYTRKALIYLLQRVGKRKGSELPYDEARKIVDDLRRLAPKAINVRRRIAPSACNYCGSIERTDSNL